MFATFVKVNDTVVIHGAPRVVTRVAHNTRGPWVSLFYKDDGYVCVTTVRKLAMVEKV